MRDDHARACKIVGWSHRAASRLITPPSFREQGIQPDHVSIPRFCMLPPSFATGHILYVDGGVTAQL